MTHKDLTQAALRWAQRNNFTAMTEVRTNTTREIPDVFGVRETSSVLIECKTSIADFKADFTKLHRKAPRFGVGDWRFYCTPQGMLNPSDIPHGWGLLEVNTKGKVKRVHGGPRGNRWGDPAPFVGNRKAEFSMVKTMLRRAVRGKRV